MEKVEREFKGIWIPAEIWLAEDLSISDKVILAEIDSLSSREDPCYASNAYFAEFFKLSESRISDCIAKLKRLGYVQQLDSPRKRRLLITCLVTENGPVGDRKRSSNPGLVTENGQHNNIVKENVVNNKEDQPSRKQSKSNESRLFSIDRDKSAKAKKWIEEKRIMILEFGFSREVQDALADFLENLVQMDALLPTLAMRSQLTRLKTITGKQLEVVQTTVSRGWKSLDYAIDDCQTQGKGKFDTAEKSSNQLYTKEEKERKRQEMQGQEQF